jgi:hypothetical protein
MSMASARIPHERHSVHWDPVGNIILEVCFFRLAHLELVLTSPQVDNVLYQLDRATLIRRSGMFQGLLSMPPPEGGTQTDGSSEYNPLRLPQLSGKGGGFDLFVAQAYGL